MRVVDLTPTRSVSDRKTYRLVAFESGFECLLVSSEYQNQVSSSTELKAAAAMSVQVGSFNDPAECEGLAHFLEHMLFMGSEKYPKENHYDAFVSSHSGFCNAQTDGEFTAYQFDISSEHFVETLDIFAQCFLCPLLSVSSSDRELQAIENEFQLAKTNDGARFQQLCCHFAKDDHILRKFSWGNINSLRTKPNSRNIHVNECLRKFYETHYVPRNCRLVVVAPIELDQIQNIVQEAFSEWCNSGAVESELIASVGIAPSKRIRVDETLSAPAIDTNASNADEEVVPNEMAAIVYPSLLEVCKPFIDQPILPESCYYSVTRVLALEATHSLCLLWQCPSSLRSQYRAKPSRYLSHLLGHEGSGSLLSALKKDRLADALTAGIPGSSLDSNCMFSLFSLQITLTERGLANWMEVVLSVMKYINLLKLQLPQKRIFDELSQIAANDYAYMDESDAADLAERLSIGMLPVFGRREEDFLCSDYLFWEYNPIDIQELLSQFRVENCKIFVMSSNFETETENEEVEKAEGDKDIAAEEEEEDEAGEGEGEDYDDDGSESESTENDQSSDNSSDDDEAEADEADDEESNEDGSAAKAANIRRHIPDETLLQLYSGPAQWAHLIVSPTTAPSLCSMCLPTAGHVDGVPSKASICSHCQSRGERRGGNNATRDMRYTSAFCDGNSTATDDNSSSEPHFGTKYWNDELPSDLVALWHSISARQLNVQLPDHCYDTRHQLPVSNPFIPSSLELVSALSAVSVNSSDDNSNNTDDCPKVPQLVHESEGLRIYHKINKQFPLPKIELIMKLSSSSLIYKSISNCILYELMILVLRDFLNESLYVACDAGLDASISSDCSNNDAVVIRISGFSDKAISLSHFIINEFIGLFMSSAKVEILPQLIKRQIECLDRSYADENMSSTQASRNMRLLCLQSFAFSAESKLQYLREHFEDSSKETKIGESIDNINVDSGVSSSAADALCCVAVLREFAQDFLASLSIDILAEGNINSSDVCHIMDKYFIQSGVSSNSDRSSHPMRLLTKDKDSLRITELPTAESLRQQQQLQQQQQLAMQLPYLLVTTSPSNQKDKNICVEWYYQVGRYNCKDAAMIELLEQVLSEPFFDDIRTKQQLGYTVDLGVRHTHHMLGFCFQVTSSTHSPVRVHKAIQSFVNNIAQSIQQLTSAELVDHVRSVITKKRTPFTSLNEATTADWNKVDDESFSFEDDEAIAALLSDLLALQSLEQLKQNLIVAAVKLFIQSTRKLLVVHSAVLHDVAAIETALGSEALQVSREEVVGNIHN